MGRSLRITYSNILTVKWLLYELETGDYVHKANAGRYNIRIGEHGVIWDDNQGNLRRMPVNLDNGQL